MRIFQKGFNYSQDGPGNRLVYHLQGCNLNCPWCANPEGLALHGGTEYTVAALVDEALSCKMMFFDGETWREIFEPEELKEVSMYLAGVASDRLLFLRNVGSWESPDVYLYQVMLDREELALEYCGQIL